MSRTKKTKSTTAAPAKTRRRKLSIKQHAKKLMKAGKGKVGTIVGLAKKGFERSEIIDAGFNKNTVHRQVREKVDLA